VGGIAGRQELLREQRVALAARVQAVDHPGIGRLARDVLERERQLFAGERLDVDPVGSRAALELGQQRPQRVAAVQLVRAVGGDHEHALGVQRARQEREERARRAVGPVDVLERQQHRRAPAEPLQQPEQRLEQPPLVARRRRLGAQLGKQRRQLVASGERGEHRVVLARERAQRADQRGVRELALAELHAVAV
jgi:hypothetical protein